jgi:hypothetical protein
MRRLLLLIFAAAMLIGLPRVADRFREANSSLSSGTVVTGTKVPMPRPDAAPEAVPADLKPKAAATLSTQPVQVSMRAGAASGLSSSASVTPRRPTTDDELIAAIQKELKRLGYYDGPVVNRWTRSARAAAQEFSGIGRPRPTAKLLASLQTAQPGKLRENGKNSVPESRTFEVLEQLPKDPHPRTALPETPVVAPEIAAPSDGYLPPWERPASSRYQLAKQTEDKLSGGPGLRALRNRDEIKAIEEEGRSEIRKRVSRRRQRVRARRYYTSFGETRVLIRRGYFRTASFDWPGL